MLFQRLINFLTGTVDCSVSDADTARLLNALKCHGVGLYSQKRRGGTLCFRVRLLSKKALDSALGEAEVCLCSRREAGLPHLLGKYRRRPGLLLGAVIFALLLYVSSRFVWDIRVSGNSEVPDSEIIAALDEMGFSVGTYAPAVDYASLCNRYLAASDNIAWISVNLCGTVAEAEVIESSSAAKNPMVKASNLVAERDGVIVSGAVGSGAFMVKPGDVVTRGTLLVSGVVEYKDGHSTLTRSTGSVYARTRRAFTAEIPLVREEKTSTGVVEGDKYIKFFSKDIKVSINSGNLPAMYDKITDRRRIVLPGGIELPVFIVTELYNGYITVPGTLTEDEGARLAWDEVYAFVDTELSDCALLSADITCGVTGEGSYRIDCVFDCVEDIALERVITLGGSGEPAAP